MRVTLVLLSLLAAGCLGAPEAPTPPTPEAQLEAAVIEALDNETPPEPVRVDLPVAYAGRTSSGACVFAAGQCMWVHNGAEDYRVIEYAGAPQKLALTFTFGEQQPTMQFYVALCRGEDAATAECLDYQTGTSPYLREWDLRQDPEGTVYRVSAASVNPAAMATSTLVFGEVAFEAAGVMTALDQAP